jgi:DNA-directed RNA polymerase specialized sigma subunit
MTEQGTNMVKGALNESAVRAALNMKSENVSSRNTIFTYLHQLELGSLSHALFLPTVQSLFVELLDSIPRKKLDGLTTKIVGTRHFCRSPDDGEIKIELHSVLRGGKESNKTALKKEIIKNVSQSLLYLKALNSNERFNREVVFVEAIFKLLSPLNFNEIIREDIWSVFQRINKAERAMYYAVARTMKKLDKNTVCSVEALLVDPAQCINNKQGLEPTEFQKLVLSHCEEELQELMTVTGLSHFTSLKRRFGHIVQLTSKFRKFQVCRNRYLQRHLGLICQHVQKFVSPLDQSYGQFCNDATLKLSMNIMRFDPAFAYSTFAVYTLQAEVTDRKKKEDLVRLPDNVFTDQKRLLQAAIEVNEDGQERFNNEKALEAIKLIDKTDTPSQERIAELRNAGKIGKYSSFGVSDEDDDFDHSLESQVATSDKTEDIIRQRDMIKKITKLVSCLPEAKARCVIKGLGLENDVDESIIGANRPGRLNEEDAMHYKALYRYASDYDNEF